MSLEEFRVRAFRTARNRRLPYDWAEEVAQECAIYAWQNGGIVHDKLVFRVIDKYRHRRKAEQQRGRHITEVEKEQIADPRAPLTDAFFDIMYDDVCSRLESKSKAYPYPGNLLGWGVLWLKEGTSKLRQRYGPAKALLQKSGDRRIHAPTDYRRLLARITRAIAGTGIVRSVCQDALGPASLPYRIRRHGRTRRKEAGQ